MDIGLKLTQSKEYNSNIVRQTYSSNLSTNSIKQMTPNQRLDEIRRKYDTPTRKQLKEIQLKSMNQKQIGGKDMQLRKSANSNQATQNTLRQKWASNVTNQSNKNYELSPASMYRKQNINHEEETIFKKIKEMKDSLLQKNYNDKIKTTKSIYQPRVPQKVQLKPQMVDHRLQNIDRINAKFQQILSCLRQSESKFPTSQLEAKQIEKQKLRQNNQYKQSIKIGNDSKYSQNSTRGNLSYNLQTKVSQSSSTQKSQGSQHSYSHSFSQNQTTTQTQPSQLKTHQNPNYQQYNNNKVEVRNTYSIYKQRKQQNNNKIFSPASKYIESSQLVKGGDSKVRSFISSIQKQTGRGKNSFYQMKSGKKLDDQINKIQSKIQQFQEQKKKLNIDFKPYSYSNSKSSSNLSKRSYTIDKYQRTSLRTQLAQNNIKNSVQSLGPRKTFGSESYYEKKVQTRGQIRNSQNISKFSIQHLREKNIQRTQINVQISKQLKSQQQQNSLFKLKLIPVETQQKNQLNQRSNNSSRIENRILSEDLRKKTDEGILDRKKKLSTQISNRSKILTKRLVEKLSAQANLDEKFRNNKLYFESNIKSNKWEQLEQALNRNGCKMDKERMQKVFKITDQQNNPFFSVRQSSNNTEDLAKSYLQCQQYWKKQLLNKINKQQLSNQQFTSNALDLQKKGYIVLQDIVRFLNMQTGTFYRNRDLYLIFKRISQNEKINFNQLIQIFCK